MISRPFLLIRLVTLLVSLAFVSAVAQAQGFDGQKIAGEHLMFIVIQEGAPGAPSSSGSRRNPDKVELAEGPIVGSHLSLTLQHMNRHRRLAVCSG